jgi:hypothetical protein
MMVVMIMTMTMVVSVMIMAVIMMMTMVVVVVVVMMIVAVLMLVVVSDGNRISPAFGLEWRFDRDKLCAQPFQQRFDGRIPLEPQPPVKHLDWDVAVTEMPGQASERAEVGGTHLDQRLGLGDHLDHGAVIEQQRVIGA